MGLIYIGKSNGDSQERIYLSYCLLQEVLQLQVVIIKESPLLFCLNLSKDDTALRKWAQNLQQSPENYLEQFYNSLQDKAVEDKETQDEFRTKNLFEINENDFIWRQYFYEKKMYGRKGKFTLEKDERKDALGQVMNKIMKDFKDKEKSIVNLEKQNRALLLEKEDLLKIAEKSVKMKEDLEKNLYKKFALLLNSKKEKLSQYRIKLYELKGCEDSRQHPAESEQQAIDQDPQVSNLPSIKDKSLPHSNLSEDDYEEDTDVDSPQAVGEAGDIAGNQKSLQKRKATSSSSVRGSGCIELKSPITVLDDSPDLLNASLEMECDTRFTSNSFKKFKHS